MNIGTLDDDYSPTKMGGVIEPHRKNLGQDTIQEESSEINSLGNKKPKDDQQRESRDFVLQLAPTAENKKGESGSKMQESESKKFENEPEGTSEANLPTRRRTDVDGCGVH